MTKVLSRLKIVSDFKSDLKKFHEYESYVNDFIKYDDDSHYRIMAAIEIENKSKYNNLINLYIKAHDYIKDFLKKYPDEMSTIIYDRYGDYFDKKFKKVLNCYNDSFNAFTAVKIKEDQDKAIDSLVNTIKKLETFDNVSRDDILNQINKFDGLVKLNGPFDLYIKFKNNKVDDKYF